jgi:cytochrome c-type biogenesis protein
MDNVTMGVAFIAGILSFLSPCILPLAPGYISFLSGISMQELKEGVDHKKIIKKAGLNSIFFVLGFSMVFIALGASASFVGQILATHMGILTKVAGVIIAVLGLHLLGVFKIKWLSYGKHINVKNSSVGILHSVLLGLAFGFGWTPCIGPILASILTLAATQETLIKGMFLLAIYSLGLGIPFILTGFAIGFFMKFIEKYKKFIRWGEIIAGGLLVIVGILVFTNNLDFIVRYMP